LLHMSCPYTSAQNRRAERIIRSTNNIVRSLLFQASLPPSYRVETLATATHVLNLLPTKTLPVGTPHSALFGTEPSYEHLRVFSCKCYPNLSATTSHKLSPCSTLCVFLGYSPHHKGYCCLDSSCLPTGSSSLVTSSLTSTTFPLWKSLLQTPRTLMSSSMHLLILCRPSPLGRHSLLCLQVIPVLLHRLPHCHVRPPAPLPYCHVRPPVLLPHNHVWPPAPLPHCHVRTLVPLRRRLFALYVPVIPPGFSPLSVHAQDFRHVFTRRQPTPAVSTPVVPPRVPSAASPEATPIASSRATPAVSLLSTLRLPVQVLLPLDCPRVLSSCPPSLISTA
jgi:hypothetical protein